MKKILFLLLTCLLAGCVSLSELPKSLDAVGTGYKNIDDSKITIVLLNRNQELCVKPRQMEYLKNVISRFYNINENEKIKVKIRSVSINDETLRVLNLVATTLTYSLIPLYDSAKYEIEVEIMDGQSQKIIKDWFVADGLISVLAIPFAFKRNYYDAKRLKIEQSLYKMSNTTGQIVPVGTKSEFKSSPICTNSFHDFFYWQRWY